MRLLLIVCISLFVCLTSAPLSAEDKSMGKLIIKIEDSIGQFADPDLESTIKNLKRRHGKFALADDESKANFLPVVLERKSEMRSPLGTPINYRIRLASFSVRDGDSWKPACKLSNGSGFNGGASWGVAANRVIAAAEKCAREKAGK